MSLKTAKKIEEAVVRSAAVEPPRVSYRELIMRSVVAQEQIGRSLTDLLTVTERIFALQIVQEDREQNGESNG